MRIQSLDSKCSVQKLDWDGQGFGNSWDLGTVENRFRYWNPLSSLLLSVCQHFFSHQLPLLHEFLKAFVLFLVLESPPQC